MVTSNNIYQLILASQSPRRKELLSFLGVKFDVISSDVDEDGEDDSPVDLACYHASLKGNDIFKKIAGNNHYPNPLIVSSDTVVFYKNKNFRKPKDMNEARDMLLELSGNTHKVVTAVYLVTNNKKKVFHVESDVSFSNITPDILDQYLQTCDSLDKAGAYGIQGAALTFVKGLQGSYSNVVGFPVVEFVSELKILLNCSGDYRKYFL